jgi:dihydrofolate reductase
VQASVFIATSLDGFIAREDGAIDWLPQGGAEDYGYRAFIETVDTIVMGRRTYETVLAFDPWPYGSIPVVVLSSRPATLRAAPSGSVEPMSGGVPDILRALERRGAGRLYVDGGQTIQRFMAAGAINRLIITRVPVLLGRGIPLFGPLPGDIQLRHIRTQSYASGLVQSEYETT